MNILSTREEITLMHEEAFYKAIVEDQEVVSSYQWIHGQKRMTTMKEHGMIREAVKDYYSPIKTKEEEEWKKIQMD